MTPARYVAIGAFGAGLLVAVLAVVLILSALP